MTALALAEYGTWADAFRVLTLVLGSGTIAVSLATAGFYAGVWWKFHRHLPRGVRWRGLLPRHVFVIAVSYNILVLWSMRAIIENLHDGSLTWRVPIGFVAYALGLWSTWDVLGSTRHRYVNIAPPPRPSDVDPHLKP